MLARFFALLAMGLLAACAAQSERPTLSFDEALQQVTGQDGKTCIRDYDIDGFGAINDSVVSVSGRGREHFLVTTRFRCNTLSTAFKVNFSGDFSEFCHGRDEIITREESCPVKHIYRFANREDAFAALDAAKERRAVSAKSDEDSG